jgi:hypothetical protein
MPTLPLFLLVLPPRIAAQEVACNECLAIVGTSFSVVVLVVLASALCGRLFRLLPAHPVPTVKEVVVVAEEVRPVTVVAGPPPAALRPPSSI